MLSKDTFVLHAMRAYDNPTCKTIIEFEEDVSKFNSLSRLCKKDFDVVVTALILNQVMTLLNVFENSVCIKLMFFKVKEEHWNKLKTALTFLNKMPDEIIELNIKNKDLAICEDMMSTLNRI